MSIDSSSSSSNSGSDIDEEAIMDQVESDLYRERIARAWEIVNRRQEELDMESDSENSSAASSLFNSMEGIETSGVKLGVEHRSRADFAPEFAPRLQVAT